MTSVARSARRRDALGIATRAVLGVGVALRLVAYARRDILWLDEAATARNIVERTLHALLAVPLDYAQAAPKGFLLLEWVASRTLGTSDLALRLLPFASSIASLFLFAAIARRLLAPAGALAAVLFFSVGYWFLVYSADVHPYGLDLALSLGALFLALELERTAFPTSRVWGTAVYGAAAVWFSNATVITLFALGIALGLVAVRTLGFRGALRALWPIAAAWAASAAGAAWVAAHGMLPSDREYFQALYRGGMVPVLRSASALRWLWDAWRVQLSLWHGWSVDDARWTSLYVALAVVGFVSLLWRRTNGAILVGSIVAAFVAVSMAKQYPYDPRFLMPSLAMFVIGVGESIGVLATAGGARSTFAFRVLAMLLCAPPIYRVIDYPPPYQWTVVGSYLRQIRGRWQPGDVVYTTYDRALEVVHSAPRFGFAREDYILGPCSTGDRRASLRAADALRGRRRVWLIAGPGLFVPFSAEYGYLRAIGVQRDSLGVRLPGSIRVSSPEPFDIPTAYLLDLSDSTRLARSTAETYSLSPLLRAMGRGANRWSCHGVWSPLVRESSGATR